jgi:hypothetical protein
MTLRMTAREFADSPVSRRLTRDQAYAVRTEKKSKSKYGNQKVDTADGLTFDSKAEYRRWVELNFLLKAKEITDLQRQVPFVLVPAQVSPDGTKLRGITYVADFTYRDTCGQLVVEDPKGASTAEWVLKKKLMLFVHGIWVREIRT